MTLKNGFSIIIPAFNEESNIGNLLQNLQTALSKIHENCDIIVVDDGSTDNTCSMAGSVQGIKVMRNPYNKGNGAAVKAGIMEAKGEKLVIIDADGQHDPKYIPEMLNLLNEYDLVVGARESFGVGRRGLGNLIVSKLASYLSGIPIPDLTCGFRAFKKDKMMEFVHLLPNGFSLPSTSTLAFAVNGYNIKFIPIQSQPRQGGKSSVKVLRDGIKFAVLIIRMVNLFKPLKVYFPVSVLLLIIGLFWSLKVYAVAKGISNLGTMLLLAGVLTFLFGLLADQLAETRLSIGRILKSRATETKEDID